MNKEPCLPSQIYFFYSACQENKVSQRLNKIYYKMPTFWNSLCFFRHLGFGNKLFKKNIATYVDTVSDAHQHMLQFSKTLLVCDGFACNQPTTAKIYCRKKLMYRNFFKIRTFILSKVIYQEEINRWFCFLQKKKKNTTFQPSSLIAPTLCCKSAVAQKRLFFFREICISKDSKDSHEGKKGYSINIPAMGKQTKWKR